MMATYLIPALACFAGMTFYYRWKYQRTYSLYRLLDATLLGIFWPVTAITAFLVLLFEEASDRVKSI